MLNRYGYRTKNSSVTDTKATSAATFTTTGRPLSISFAVKLPPASSTFFYHWHDMGDEDDNDCLEEEPQVIAAHVGYLLIELMVPGDDSFRANSSSSLDYFLYDAGDLLPSLSLLPQCFFPMEFERGMTRHYPQPRVLRKEDTGVLLRRGEDDDEVMVVAQLEVTADDTAELCVLFAGRSDEWELRPVPIVHGEGMGSDDETAGEPMCRRWQTDAVVPVAGRFLCWVDYFRGVLVCDMSSPDIASLKLLSLPLPVHSKGRWPWPSFDGSRSDPRWSMNLSSAGDDNALKFIGVEPRRCSCCGAAGQTTICTRGRSGFTVRTWIMRLAAEEEAMAMRWEEESVLDSNELWALPGYERVPRVTVKYPIVSLEDHDVVCFMVTEDDFVYRAGTRIWMVQVDMRSKAVRSVICEMADRWGEGYHLAVNLQC